MFVRGKNKNCPCGSPCPRRRKSSNYRRNRCSHHQPTHLQQRLQLRQLQLHDPSTRSQAPDKHSPLSKLPRYPDLASAICIHPPLRCGKNRSKSVFARLASGDNTLGPPSRPRSLCPLSLSISLSLCSRALPLLLRLECNLGISAKRFALHARLPCNSLHVSKN
jgi:hypothetical protein